MIPVDLRKRNYVNKINVLTIDDTARVFGIKKVK